MKRSTRLQSGCPNRSSRTLTRNWTSASGSWFQMCTPLARPPKLSTRPWIKRSSSRQSRRPSKSANTRETRLASHLVSRCSSHRQCRRRSTSCAPPTSPNPAASPPSAMVKATNSHTAPWGKNRRRSSLSTKRPAQRASRLKQDASSRSITSSSLNF